MKIINSITIITLSAILISCFGGSDDIDKNTADNTPIIQDQSADMDELNNKISTDTDSFIEQTDNVSANNIPEKNNVPSRTNTSSTDTDNLSDRDSGYYGDVDTSYNSSYGNTDSSYDQYDSNYGSTDSSYDQYDSNYGNTDSAYDQYDSNYANNSSSYDQNDATNANADSSYGQNNSSYGNAGALYAEDNSADNSNDTATNNEQADSETEDTDSSENTNTAENPETVNYQRVYDNGVIWYGNLGTLAVQYQSPDPETTGIGFRVHFDNSSMRVTNVTFFPVDAISATSPQTLMPDTNNYDNDRSTSHFLPFAWASMYGQWPQANQVNLATIEFERVDGGSTNYGVNYSPISVAAGFRFIR
jgi:hypothetical protein